MNRARVSSSSLASIGYDPDNKILEVEFRHAGIYQYFDVPERVYRDLMAASSHGRYFEVYVKKVGYRFRKIK
jgi:hypothetical protein